MSRSHLETWSTMRASAATGPSPTCAERVTRAAVPSWRVKVASPSTPCRVPLARRIAVTDSSGMSWFLVENGSMQGVMIRTRASSSPSQA
ncbi:MAG: hypothetical protein AUI87_01665 [Actinobacteria bacterium 13_1_40CM_3_66_19]|nr:MAG: hypothetical protein AUI87_01665 [Actinobacteria bacterium 13_1_40CM_3_66_19]